MSQHYHHLISMQHQPPPEEEEDTMGHCQQQRQQQQQHQRGWRRRSGRRMRKSFSLVTSLSSEELMCESTTTDLTADASSSFSCSSSSSDFDIPRRRASLAGALRQRFHSYPTSIDWDESSLQQFLSNYCCPMPQSLEQQQHQHYLHHAVERISIVLNDSNYPSCSVHVRFEGHTLLGGILLTLQQPRLAIRSFLNALWISTQSHTNTNDDDDDDDDDTLRIAMTLHRLGYAYWQSGNGSDAIPALRKAVSAYRYEDLPLTRHARAVWMQAAVQERCRVRRRLIMTTPLDLIPEES